VSDAFERLAAARVVPVLTAGDADEAEQVCRALVAGGLPVVEITFRTGAAADAIRRAARVDGLLVGAGTIVAPEQIEAALGAGARFAVAPGTSPDVVRAAQHAGLPFVPGVATPTEVERASALGCGVVKVFPASLLGGPPFLKALAAVYPEVGLVPTGGIDPENLVSYLEVPAVVACGGSWICDRALLRERRFDDVERRAREAVELAARAAV
jgi:2-dehydro-3-deoxyphosphogluconate aldolase/(4S)-4-hydroxy-2-oxoglutarate aldolase